MADIVFGHVPKPAMVELIVSKPAEGRGFDRVPPRKIVGTCNHRTEGRDTPESVSHLFSTGGERQYDALTDYCIGTDGRIGHLNDEYGTRAGWANGGSDGLEGDGPNFVKTFGVVGINSRLASIEHCGLGGDPVTPQQFESSARLNAWVFDKAGVPYDTFPIHPKFGVVTQLEHWEFATKGCPGAQFRAHTDELHQRIRALLKEGQTKTASDGGMQPPVTPVEPAHGTYPKGMDAGLAEMMFGKITKHNLDGTETKQGFSEKGAVSMAWLARGVKEKQFPEGDDWWQFEDSKGVVRDVITFSNGWTLWRANTRQGWTWM